MTETDQDVEWLVFACLPVDRSQLPVVDGVEAPKPTILHRLSSCECCSQAIWVGPRQDEALKALRADARPTYVYCYFCAADYQRHHAERGAESVVRHLGGGEGAARA